MGALLGAAFLLCGVGAELTYAQDPFDLIFGNGDDAESISPTQTAHEDNIRLVSFWLRDFLLIEAATAFETADGLCLDASPVLEALKLPLSIKGDDLTGWVGQKNRDITYNFRSELGILDGKEINSADVQAIETPQGWCLSLQTLTSLTKIDFEYRESLLSVVATPREVLPLESKLERARIREAQLQETSNARPNFLKIETPYQWLSAPTADITLDLDTRKPSGLRPTLAFEAAGDFLKTTTRIRSVETRDGGQSFRMTLGRSSEQDDQLGFLKARRFSLGHISVPSTPLTRRSRTGLGATLSNSPDYRPELFDETEIRGALPIGWEAELYQDGRIIDFTDQPDSNGDYLFSNVPLTLGFNRLVVRLYGPYGELEERVISLFVGDTQCPDGEWRYTISFIDPDDQTIRPIEADMDLLDQDLIQTEERIIDARPTLLATIEHGLTKRFSMRLDGEMNDQGMQTVAASLQGAFNRFYGGVRLAGDGGGLPAVEAYSQAQLSDTSSLSVRLTEFGDLQSDYAGQGEGRLARKARVRFDTRLGRRFGYLPIRSELNVQQTRRGEQNLTLTSTTGSTFRGVNWNHNVAYSLTDGTSALEGGLILSRTVQGTRVRAGLGYGLRNSLSLNGLSLSAQRNLGRNTRLQLSSAYDMSSKALGGEVGLTRSFKNFTLTGRSGMSQSRDWYAGLNLAFSLYKPQDSWRYRMARPGLSRTGSIRFLSYADENADSDFDTNEAPVSGLKFIVDNSLRSNQSGNDGVNIISSIEPNRTITVEPQLSSIDDPFLIPAQRGYELSVRPGQLMTVKVPLRPTGDMDGTAQLQRGEHLTPLAGVIIEFVTETGSLIKQVRTEYDGYFYADGLPVGTVIVRIAKESLDLIGADSETIPATLTPDMPSLSGLKLLMTTVS